MGNAFGVPVGIPLSGPAVALNYEREVLHLALWDLCLLRRAWTWSGGYGD